MKLNKSELIKAIEVITDLDEPYKTKFNKWLKSKPLTSLIAYYASIKVSSKKYGGKQK